MFVIFVIIQKKAYLWTTQQARGVEAALEPARSTTHWQRSRPAEPLVLNYGFMIHMIHLLACYTDTLFKNKAYLWATHQASVLGSRASRVHHPPAAPAPAEQQSHSSAPASVAVWPSRRKCAVARRAAAARSEHLAKGHCHKYHNCHTAVSNFESLCLGGGLSDRRIEWAEGGFRLWGLVWEAIFLGF